MINITLNTVKMNTSISQPIYQETMAINRTLQQLTRGYHSNGTFNLAFKIKDDIINICNSTYLDKSLFHQYILTCIFIKE